MIMKKFKNIYVEITNECNLACSFCPSHILKLNEKMSMANFKIIIDKIKDYTEGIYLHILGEPLLNKDIFDFINYASRYLKVSLTTNGILINKYHRELINNNLYIMNISLQCIYQLKEEQRDNYFKLVRDLIIDPKRMVAVHLRIWNDKIKNRELNEYILKKIEQYSLLSYPNVNLSLMDEFEWPDIEQNNYSIGTCLGGKKQLAIHVNGNVSLCCLDYQEKTIIGNIFQDDLEQILKNELYENALLGWQKDKPYFPLCQKCNYKSRFRR